MKRRLECVTGGASKFWEIAVEAASHTVRFGKLGTDGQIKTKSFDSHAAALKDAEALVRSKLAGGYVEPGAIAPAGVAPAVAKAIDDTSGVTMETVPLLVRGAIAAIDDRAVVSVGKALVLLEHDGKNFVASVVAPEADLTASAPAIAAGASLHVFYCEQGGSVRACVQSASGWSNDEVFKPEGEVTPGGRGLAAASDASGNVWVAVVSAADEMALLSNRSGKFAIEHRWRARGRPMTYSTHPFVDIACHGTTVFLAYLDLDTLKVARFEAGGFSEETVREKAGGWVSLAVDAAGSLHLAYMNWSGPKNDFVEYATRGAAGWTFEVADKKGHAGYQTRLLMSDGEPLVYFGERGCRYSPERAALGGGNTRMAARKSGKWSVTPGRPDGWALALARFGGRPVGFATASPMDESGHLQVTHFGAALHASGGAVTGAPQPRPLLLGGLKLQLFGGSPVYLEHGGRFWEITLGGTTYSVRIGKVGAAGSSKTSSFESDDAARAAALKALDKKYNSDFFKEPVVAAAESAHVASIMAGMKAAAERSIAADAQETAERQTLPSDQLPMFWDTLGEGGPLLGRLRGVTARGEIREHLGVGGGRIYFAVRDAHFVFRRAVPKELPDFITNAERQLVASKRLADALGDVPGLEALPVRLVDIAGKEISRDYLLLEVKVTSKCIGRSSGKANAFDPTSYYYASIENPPPGEAVGAALPPISRASNTLLIACNAATAARVAPFSGVRLIPLAELRETFWPPADASYHLLRAGDATEFGMFESDFDFEEALETGKALSARWPKDATMKMKGAKSAKKIIAFMRGPGAPVISDEAKRFLEEQGATDVEFLPVKLQDHAGKEVAGSFFVLNVLATQPYVDIDESDIESTHGYLWTAREIVVDEGALSAPPLLFRVPGARYPWVFGRVELLAAAEKAKLAGLRGFHPGKYAYPTESGGLRSFC